MGGGDEDDASRDKVAVDNGDVEDMAHVDDEDEHVDVDVGVNERDVLADVHSEAAFVLLVGTVLRLWIVKLFLCCFWPWFSFWKYPTKHTLWLQL